MAKEQTKATIDPNGLVLGGQIFAEDAQAIIKNANWVYGNRGTVHLSQQVGAELDGAGDVVAPQTLGIEFRATASGMVKVLMFYVYLLPETVNVTVGAACYMMGGDCDVKFTIGAASQTISYSFASGHSGTERTATLATSSTGTGWQLCEIEIEKTSGTSAQTLHRVRVQDDGILTGLPSPVTEGDSETVDVQEEGSAVVLSARKINFVGSSVTASAGSDGVANVTVSAGGALTVSAISASVSAVADTYYVVDSSGAAVTVTLPAAATAGSGARVAVKARHGATNAVTIAANGTESIDGAASGTVVLSTDNARAQVTCDGSAWWID